MSSHWGPQVFRSDDLGRTWERDRRRRDPRSPRTPERRSSAVWQLAPARRRARRGLRRHRAVGAVPLRPTAARPSSWCAASGTTRTARTGSRARRQAIHTVCRTRPTPTGHGRDVDRRRLPHRSTVARPGRRPTSASRPSSCRRPVPRVRPVRAQGGADAGSPTPALRAEPRRRLPHRRRRRVLDVDRRRAAERLRFPDGRRPQRRRDIYVFPLVADGERFPPEAKAAGLEVTRRRPVLERTTPKGCPRTPSTPGDARRDVAPTTRARPASTSARVTARSTPATTRPRPGRGRRTSDVMCVRAGHSNLPRRASPVRCRAPGLGVFAAPVPTMWRWARSRYGCGVSRRAPGLASRGWGRREGREECGRRLRTWSTSSPAAVTSPTAWSATAARGMLRAVGLGDDDFAQAADRRRVQLERDHAVQPVARPACARRSRQGVHAGGRLPAGVRRRSRSPTASPWVTRGCTSRWSRAR